jgi:hypothetical protein
MAIQLSKVFVPLPTVAPRGAEWVSELATKAARMGRKLWAALEKLGQERAQRELDWLAIRHAHNPELAQALRDAMNRGNRG